MNNYLIALGGTGQHVALAFVDYLALAHHTTGGRFPAAGDHWKIILIDADQEKDQDDKSAWGLCRQQAKRLKDLGISIDTAAHKPVEKLTTVFGETTPASLLSSMAPPAITSVLEQVLFTPAQARLPIMNGFYGEPRVAAFVGRRWLRSALEIADHDLRDVETKVKTDPKTVRVAIVGSSAGGTGAGLLDPFRRWLLALAPEAGRSLLVDIGLEWFRIDGAKTSSLAHRMRHNAASCLFPFLAEEKLHRLVIWGHPSVSAATEESDQTDTRQAAKRNLTLPWFGATALVDFFSAAEMPGESTLAAERVSVRSLYTPLLNFEELVAKNRRVMGRLRLTRAYLSAPYDGWRLPVPPFRGKGRVPVLDGASNKADLIARIDRLLAAKTDALTRLSRSESQNALPAVNTEPDWFHSTKVLRQLYPATADAARCGEGAAEIPLGPPTQRRLLPETAVPRTSSAGNAAPDGTLAPLADQERSGLADLNVISGTRIPALSGVRQLITAFLKSNAVWTGCLADSDGKPRIPPRLAGPTDDQADEWMSRWLLIVRGLVSGAVHRSPLTGVPSALRKDLTADGIDVAGLLTFERQGRSYVVGHLDESFVAIPSVGAFWHDQDAIDALDAAAGAISRLMTLCDLTKRIVGEDSRPPWVDLLDSEFPSALKLKNLRASGQTVKIRWGTEVLDWPLPAEQGPKPLDLAFGNRPAPELPGDPSGAGSIAELSRFRIQGGDPASQIFIRSDLRTHYRDDFLGSSVRVGGASIDLSGTTMLEKDEIFTKSIIQLRNSVVPYAMPVRAAAAPLVARCTYLLRGSTLHVTLTLRNAANTQIEEKYSVDQILQDSKILTSLYLWPSVATEQQQAVWALVSRDGQLDRDIRILWSTAPVAIAPSGDSWTTTFPENLSMQGDWLPLASRGRLNRILPRTLSAGQRARFVVLRVGLTKEIVEEAGLIPYVPQQPEDGGPSSERWCVDFGTSSSVVAMRTGDGGGSRRSIMRIRGGADSTTTPLAGVEVPRRDLKWFATWDGQAPIHETLAGEMPSHVIVFDNRTPGSAATSNPELGTDYVVDLGWTLNDDVLRHLEKVKIREHLKWSSEALRSKYNRDVLETMLQLRVRSSNGGRGLPAQLPITFTVPYRQVTTLNEFKNSIEAAIEEVKRSFGVEIQPSYLWESQGLRPEAASSDEGIFIGADLGGGSLDMYAALYRLKDGYVQIVDEIIDSARVGADALVASWSRASVFPEITGGTDQTALYKAAIRYDRVTSAQLKAANDTDFAILYWGTIRRYMAVWSAAVADHWAEGEQRFNNVTLERLGLGWDLFDRAGIPTAWTQTLNTAASEMGLDVTFTERTSTREGRSRKEELAYRALHKDDIAVPTVEELRASHPKLLLGIDLNIRGATYAASRSMSDVVSPQPGAIRPADASRLQALLGAPQEAVNELIEKMNKEEKHGGMISTAGAVRQLSISPLTVLAERILNAETE